VLTVKANEAVTRGMDDRLPPRLLVWRLPEEAAARRRAKMRENAANVGRTVSAASLALCDWNLLITNLGRDQLTLAEGFLLNSVRWRIELLFKLWKSQCQLTHSRSAKPYHILCEVYAKLLGCLIEHWLLLTGLWRYPERSLVKGARCCENSRRG
jgi:IS4 transposase